MKKFLYAVIILTLGLSVAGQAQGGPVTAAPLSELADRRTCLPYMEQIVEVTGAYASADPSDFPYDHPVLKQDLFNCYRIRTLEAEFVVIPAYARKGSAADLIFAEKFTSHPYKQPVPEAQAIIVRGKVVNVGSAYTARAAIIVDDAKWVAEPVAAPPAPSPAPPPAAASATASSPTAASAPAAAASSAAAPSRYTENQLLYYNMALPAGSTADAVIKDGVAYEASGEKPTIFPAGRTAIVGVLENEGDRDYYLVKFNPNDVPHAIVQVFAGRLGIENVEFKYTVSDLKMDQDQTTWKNIFHVPLEGYNAQGIGNRHVSEGVPDPAWSGDIGASRKPMEVPGYYLVEVRAELHGSGARFPARGCPYILQVKFAAGEADAVPPQAEKTAALALASELGVKLGHDDWRVDLPATGAAIDPARPPAIDYPSFTHFMSALSSFVSHDGKITWIKDINVLDFPADRNGFVDIVDASGKLYARFLMERQLAGGGSQQLLRPKERFVAADLAGEKLPAGDYILKFHAGNHLFFESPFSVEAITSGEGRYAGPPRHVLHSEFENFFEIKSKGRNRWSFALHLMNSPKTRRDFREINYKFILYRDGSPICQGGFTLYDDMDDIRGPNGEGMYRIAHAMDETPGGADLDMNTFNPFGQDGTYKLVAQTDIWGGYKSVTFRVANGKVVPQGRQTEGYTPASRRIVAPSGTYFIEGSRE